MCFCVRSARLLQQVDRLHQMCAVGPLDKYDMSLRLMLRYGSLDLIHVGKQAESVGV